MAKSLVEGFSLEYRIIDPHGNVIPDAPYTVLNLSVRARNCLGREQRWIKDRAHDTVMISDLLCMSQRELTSIRNMGTATVEEVIREVHRYLLSPEEYAAKAETVEQEPVFAKNYEVVDQVIRHKSSGDIVSDAPLSDLDLSYWNFKKMTDGGLTRVSDLVGLTLSAFREKSGLGKKMAGVVSGQLLEYLQNNAGHSDQPVTATVIVSPEKILEFLGGYEFCGVTLEQLKERFPEVEDAVLDQLLCDMASDNLITREGDLVKKAHRSFFQYAFTSAKADKPKLSDRHLDVLRWRMMGNSLEELGKSMDLTRERVRQIEKKAFNLITDEYKVFFTEDALAYLYTNYEISREMFVSGMNQPPQNWYYLSCRYDRGSRDPHEALEDPAIAVEIRFLLEQYFHRDDLFVRNRYIRRTRMAIEDYLVETACRDEMHVDQFLELYRQFISDQGLAEDEELKWDESLRQSRINRLMRSNSVLWKQDMFLRYYDIKGEDYTELLDTLNLGSYHDIELSTFKWINDYPDLMRQYDIRDEYELHNLLKKINVDKQVPGMKFGRMPGILFGTFDRTQAAKEIMFALAPVSVDDLAEMIHLEYGFNKDSIKANWLGSLDRYYHMGMYSVDYEDMPASQMAALREVLTDDFYNFAELRQLYQLSVPDPDLSLLSSYNLKRLGFLVGAGYVVRNTWSSADAYFDHLLMDTDRVDMSESCRRFSNIHSFDSSLCRHRDSMDILEYEPHRYVNIRMLEKMGFTRERLRTYGDRVFDYVSGLRQLGLEGGALLAAPDTEDVFFSVRSLKVSGFTDELDALGFGDLFCASVLKLDKRFSWQRIGGMPVFNLNGIVFDTRLFLRAYIAEQRSVSAADLESGLAKRFGILLKRDTLMEKGRGEETYYDPVMDTFYAGYDVFEQENRTLFEAVARNEAPQSDKGVWHAGDLDIVSIVYKGQKMDLETLKKVKAQEEAGKDGR